ncbi:MAG: response regulator transcription factor [Alphaproteobacteria bacterium]
MATAKRVLIIDDDAELRRELADLLHLHEQLDVREASDGRNGLEKATEGHVDLILLDVGLPDSDGRDLCRRMRKTGVKAPIIMLTAADTDADAILGLDSGANDYVAKPFRLPLLLARIRAQLRQFELSDDASFPLGPYSFRPAVKMLIDEARQRKVHLTEKETAIVKFLYRVGDRAIPRDQLLDEVWGYNAGVTTHTLETHIYRLRQKIEASPEQPSLLVTEPGGYRLVR